MLGHSSHLFLQAKDTSVLLGVRLMGTDHIPHAKKIIESRKLLLFSSASERSFVKHSINFAKIWSSERESKSLPIGFQVMMDYVAFERPICPEGSMLATDHHIMFES